MTTPLGVWQITDTGPRRLASTEVDLERHLEEWIERDPSLLQQGLTIVARQMVIEGGRLDLLAMDVQGRLTLIEIKAGTVRRTTVAQAIDYASCLAAMPESELAARIDEYLGRHPSPASPAANGTNNRPRTYAALREEITGETASHDAWSESDLRDITIQVVGTGRDPGLERMINFLSAKGDIDVSVVTFEVFQTASGERVLIRELTAADDEVMQRRENERKSRITADDVLALAEKSGIGKPFRMLYDAAIESGLYPRPYRTSIMYAPQANKTRCIIYSRAIPSADGRLRFFVEADAVQEFFGIPTDRTRAVIPSNSVWSRGVGENKHWLEQSEVPRMAGAIRELFAGGENQ